MPREHHRRRSSRDSSRRRSRRRSRDQYYTTNTASAAADAASHASRSRQPNRRNSRSSLSSSSSSSYLDISRYSPPARAGNIFTTFFTAPSEHRRRARTRRAATRILAFNNSSSSSVDSDLAYGTGFLRRSRGRGSNRNSPQVAHAQPHADGRHSSQRQSQQQQQQQHQQQPLYQPQHHQQQQQPFYQPQHEQHYPYPQRDARQYEAPAHPHTDPRHHDSRPSVPYLPSQPGPVAYDPRHHRSQDATPTMQNPYPVPAPARTETRYAGSTTATPVAALSSALGLREIDGTERTDSRFSSQVQRDSRVPSVSVPRPSREEPEGGAPTRPSRLRRTGTDEEIMEIGRRLTQLQSDIDQAETRPTGLVSGGAKSRGIGPSRYKNRESSDDEWESASDSGDEDDPLAYGSGVSLPRPSHVAARPPPAAPVSTRPEPPTHRSSIVDPRLFGPQNSLHGVVTPIPGPAPTKPSRMKHVQPTPIDNSADFDARSAPAHTISQVYPKRSRAAEVPLEQPRPVAPVSPQRLEHSSYREEKSRKSSSGDKTFAAVTTAVAAGVVGSSVFSENKSREPSYSSRREDKVEPDYHRRHPSTRDRPAEKPRSGSYDARDSSQRERQEEKPLPAEKPRPGSYDARDSPQRERQEGKPRPVEYHARDSPRRERQEEKPRPVEYHTRDSPRRDRPEEKPRPVEYHAHDSPRRERPGRPIISEEQESEAARKERLDREYEEYVQSFNRKTGRSRRSKPELEEEPASLRQENREEEETRRRIREIRDNRGSPVSRKSAVASNEEGYREKQVPAGPTKAPIDPFQFQVADDAFRTPSYSRPATPPKQEVQPGPPSTAVFTVEREPTFSSPDYDPHPRLSRKDSFEIEQLAEMARSSSTRQPSPRRRFDDEEEELKRAYYEARRRARSPESAEPMEDPKPLEKQDLKDDHPPEKDPVLEEADRFYRRSQAARKNAAEEIRSRSGSRRRSVVDQWKEEEEEEPEPEILIVTPPELEEKSPTGLYGGPDADVRIDNILEHPSLLSRFLEERGRSAGPTLFSTRDPSAERERPLVNVVRPTPIGSPSPERRVEKDEERKSRSRSRSQSKSGSRSRSASRTGEQAREESSDPNIMIGPRGEIIQLADNKVGSAEPVEARTPRSEVQNPSTETRSAWGIVNAVLATKFAASQPSGEEGEADVAREAEPGPADTRVDSQPEYPVPTEAQRGATPLDEAAAPVTLEIIEDPALVDDLVDDDVGTPDPIPEVVTKEAPLDLASLESGPAAEPERRSASPEDFSAEKSPAVRGSSEKTFDALDNDGLGDLPPLPESMTESVPDSKAITPKTRSIPGAFDDDFEFAATLSAGLKAAGFEDSIVVEDPQYRHRDSPPGSNDEFGPDTRTRSSPVLDQASAEEEWGGSFRGNKKKKKKGGKKQVMDISSPDVVEASMEPRPTESEEINLAPEPEAGPRTEPETEPAEDEWGSSFGAKKKKKKGGKKHAPEPSSPEDAARAVPVLLDEPDDVSASALDHDPVHETEATKTEPETEPAEDEWGNSFKAKKKKKKGGKKQAVEVEPSEDLFEAVSAEPTPLEEPDVSPAPPVLDPEPRTEPETEPAEDEWGSSFGGKKKKKKGNKKQVVAASTPEDVADPIEIPEDAPAPESSSRTEPETEPAEDEWVGNFESKKKKKKGGKRQTVVSPPPEEAVEASYTFAEGLASAEEAEVAPGPEHLPEPELKTEPEPEPAEEEWGSTFGSKKKKKKGGKKLAMEPLPSEEAAEPAPADATPSEDAAIPEPEHAPQPETEPAEEEWGSALKGKKKKKKGNKKYAEEDFALEEPVETAPIVTTPAEQPDLDEAPVLPSEPQVGSHGEEPDLQSEPSIERSASVDEDTEFIAPKKLNKKEQRKRAKQKAVDPWQDDDAATAVAKEDQWDSLIDADSHSRSTEPSPEDAWDLGADEATQPSSPVEDDRAPNKKLTKKEQRKLSKQQKTPMFGDEPELADDLPKDESELLDTPAKPSTDEPPDVAPGPEMAAEDDDVWHEAEEAPEAPKEPPESLDADPWAMPAKKGKKKKGRQAAEFDWDKPEEQEQEKEAAPPPAAEDDPWAMPTKKGKKKKGRQAAEFDWDKPEEQVQEQEKEAAPPPAAEDDPWAMPAKKGKKGKKKGKRMDDWADPEPPDKGLEDSEETGLMAKPDDVGQDSFLANADTRGEGVGLPVAVAAAVAGLSALTRSNASKSSLKGAENLMTDDEPTHGQADALDLEVVERVVKPAIDPQYGDLLPLPPSAPGSPGEVTEDLPGLPASRPDTPPETVYSRTILEQKNRRKSIHDSPHARSPSQTAIPVPYLFGQRSNPSSPRVFRHSPMSSPVSSATDASLTKKGPARPVSWESTKDIRPLYLATRREAESPRRAASPMTSDREWSAARHEFGHSPSSSLDLKDAKMQFSLPLAAAGPALSDSEPPPEAEEMAQEENIFATPKKKKKGGKKKGKEKAADSEEISNMAATEPPIEKSPYSEEPTATTLSTNEALWDNAFDIQDLGKGEPMGDVVELDPAPSGLLKKEKRKKKKASQFSWSDETPEQPTMQTSEEPLDEQPVVAALIIPEEDPAPAPSMKGKKKKNKGGQRAWNAEEDEPASRGLDEALSQTIDPPPAREAVLDGVFTSSKMKRSKGKKASVVEQQGMPSTGDTEALDDRPLATDQPADGAAHGDSAWDDFNADENWADAMEELETKEPERSPPGPDDKPPEASISAPEPLPTEDDFGVHFNKKGKKKKGKKSDKTPFEQAPESDDAPALKTETVADFPVPGPVPTVTDSTPSSTQDQWDTPGRESTGDEWSAPLKSKAKKEKGKKRGNKASPLTSADEPTLVEDETLAVGQTPQVDEQKDPEGMEDEWTAPTKSKKAKKGRKSSQDFSTGPTPSVDDASVELEPSAELVEEQSAPSSASSEPIESLPLLESAMSGKKTKKAKKKKSVSFADFPEENLVDAFEADPTVSPMPEKDDPLDVSLESRESIDRGGFMSMEGSWADAWDASPPPEVAAPPSETSPVEPASGDAEYAYLPKSTKKKNKGKAAKSEPTRELETAETSSIQEETPDPLGPEQPSSVASGDDAAAVLADAGWAEEPAFGSASGKKGKRQKAKSRASVDEAPFEDLPEKEPLDDVESRSTSELLLPADPDAAPTGEDDWSCSPSSKKDKKKKKGKVASFEHELLPDTKSEGLAHDDLDPTISLVAEEEPKVEDEWAYTPPSKKGKKKGKAALVEPEPLPETDPEAAAILGQTQDDPASIADDRQPKAEEDDWAFTPLSKKDKKKKGKAKLSDPTPPPEAELAGETTPDQDENPLLPAPKEEETKPDDDWSYTTPSKNLKKKKKKDKSSSADSDPPPETVPDAIATSTQDKDSVASLVGKDEPEVEDDGFYASPPKTDKRNKKGKGIQSEIDTTRGLELTEPHNDASLGNIDTQPDEDWSSSLTEPKKGKKNKKTKLLIPEEDSILEPHPSPAGQPTDEETRGDGETDIPVGEWSTTGMDSKDKKKKKKKKGLDLSEPELQTDLQNEPAHERSVPEGSGAPAGAEPEPVDDWAFTPKSKKEKAKKKKKGLDSSEPALDPELNISPDTQEQAAGDVTEDSRLATGALGAEPADHDAFISTSENDTMQERGTKEDQVLSTPESEPEVLSVSGTTLAEPTQASPEGEPWDDLSFKSSSKKDKKKKKSRASLEPKPGAELDAEPPRPEPDLDAEIPLPLSEPVATEPSKESQPSLQEEPLDQWNFTPTSKKDKKKKKRGMPAIEPDALAEGEPDVPELATELEPTLDPTVEGEWEVPTASGKDKKKKKKKGLATQQSFFEPESSYHEQPAEFEPAAGEALPPPEQIADQTADRPVEDDWAPMPSSKKDKKKKKKSSFVLESEPRADSGDWTEDRIEANAETLLEVEPPVLPAEPTNPRYREDLAPSPPHEKDEEKGKQTILATSEVGQIVDAVIKGETAIFEPHDTEASQPLDPLTVPDSVPEELESEQPAAIKDELSTESQPAFDPPVPSSSKKGKKKKQKGDAAFEPQATLAEAEPHIPGHAPTAEPEEDPLAEWAFTPTTKKGKKKNKNKSLVEQEVFDIAEKSTPAPEESTPILDSTSPTAEDALEDEWSSPLLTTKDKKKKKKGKANAALEPQPSGDREAASVEDYPALAELPVTETEGPSAADPQSEDEWAFTPRSKDKKKAKKGKKAAAISLEAASESIPNLDTTSHISPESPSEAVLELDQGELVEHAADSQTSDPPMAEELPQTVTSLDLQHQADEDDWAIPLTGKKGKKKGKKRDPSEPEVLAAPSDPPILDVDESTPAVEQQTPREDIGETALDKDEAGKQRSPVLSSMEPESFNLTEPSPTDATDIVSGLDKSPDPNYPLSGDEWGPSTFSSKKDKKKKKKKVALFMDIEPEPSSKPEVEAPAETETATEAVDEHPQAIFDAPAVPEAPEDTWSFTPLAKKDKKKKKKQRGMPSPELEPVSQSQFSLEPSVESSPLEPGTLVSPVGEQDALDVSADDWSSSLGGKEKKKKKKKSLTSQVEREPDSTLEAALAAPDHADEPNIFLDDVPPPEISMLATDSATMSKKDKKKKKKTRDPEEGEIDSGVARPDASHATVDQITESPAILGPITATGSFAPEDEWAFAPPSDDRQAERSMGLSDPNLEGDMTGDPTPLMPDAPAEPADYPVWTEEALEPSVEGKMDDDTPPADPEPTPAPLEIDETTTGAVLGPVEPARDTPEDLDADLTFSGSPAEEFSFSTSKKDKKQKKKKKGSHFDSLDVPIEADPAPASEQALAPRDDESFDVSVDNTRMAPISEEEEGRSELQDAGEAGLVEKGRKKKKKKSAISLEEVAPQSSSVPSEPELQISDPPQEYVLPVQDVEPEDEWATGGSSKKKKNKKKNDTNFSWDTSQPNPTQVGELPIERAQEDTQGEPGHAEQIPESELATQQAEQTDMWAPSKKKKQKKNKRMDSLPFDLNPEPLATGESKDIPPVPETESNDTSLLVASMEPEALVEVTDINIVTPLPNDDGSVSEPTESAKASGEKLRAPVDGSYIPESDTLALDASADAGSAHPAMEQEPVLEPIADPTPADDDWSFGVVGAKKNKKKKGKAARQDRSSQSVLGPVSQDEIPTSEQGEEAQLVPALDEAEPVKLPQAFDDVDSSSQPRDTPTPTTTIPAPSRPSSPTVDDECPPLDDKHLLPADSRSQTSHAVDPTEPPLHGILTTEVVTGDEKLIPEEPSDSLTQVYPAQDAAIGDSRAEDAIDDAEEWGSSITKKTKKKKEKKTRGKDRSDAFTSAVPRDLSPMRDASDELSRVPESLAPDHSLQPEPSADIEPEPMSLGDNDKSSTPVDDADEWAFTPKKKGKKGKKRETSAVDLIAPEPDNSAKTLKTHQDALPSSDELPAASLDDVFETGPPPTEPADDWTSTSSSKKSKKNKKRKSETATPVTSRPLSPIQAAIPIEPAKLSSETQPDLPLAPTLDEPTESILPSTMSDTPIVQESALQDAIPEEPVPTPPVLDEVDVAIPADPQPEKMEQAGVDEDWGFTPSKKKGKKNKLKREVADEPTLAASQPPSPSSRVIPSTDATDFLESPFADSSAPDAQPMIVDAEPLADPSDDWGFPTTKKKGKKKKGKEKDVSRSLSPTPDDVAAVDDAILDDVDASKPNVVLSPEPISAESGSQSRALEDPTELDPDNWSFSSKSKKKGKKGKKAKYDEPETALPTLSRPSSPSAQNDASLQSLEGVDEPATTELEPTTVLEHNISDAPALSRPASPAQGDAVAQPPEPADQSTEEISSQPTVPPEDLLVGTEPPGGPLRQEEEEDWGFADAKKKKKAKKAKSKMMDLALQPPIDEPPPSDDADHTVMPDPEPPLEGVDDWATPAKKKKGKNKSALVSDAMTSTAPQPPSATHEEVIPSIRDTPEPNILSPPADFTDPIQPDTDPAATAQEEDDWGFSASKKKGKKSKKKAQAFLSTPTVSRPPSPIQDEPTGDQSTHIPEATEELSLLPPVIDESVPIPETTGEPSEAPQSLIQQAPVPQDQDEWSFTAPKKAKKGKKNKAMATDPIPSRPSSPVSRQAPILAETLDPPVESLDPHVDDSAPTGQEEMGERFTTPEAEGERAKERDAASDIPAPNTLQPRASSPVNEPIGDQVAAVAPPVPEIVEAEPVDDWAFTSSKKNKGKKGKQRGREVDAPVPVNVSKNASPTREAETEVGSNLLETTADDEWGSLPRKKSKKKGKKDKVVQHDFEKSVEMPFIAESAISETAAEPASKALDFDLTPAQAISHIIHEAPYERSPRPEKKLRVDHVEETILLSEPILSLAEPSSVGRGDDEHWDESRDVDLGDGFLGSRPSKYDDSFMEDAYEKPQKAADKKPKEAKSKGKGKEAEAVVAAAPAVAAAVGAVSSLAQKFGGQVSRPKKKQKAKKIVDKRGDREPDLFDDPVLWETSDRKTLLGEEVPGEVDAFWGGGKNEVLEQIGEGPEVSGNFSEKADDLDFWGAGKDDEPRMERGGPTAATDEPPTREVDMMATDEDQAVVDRKEKAGVEEGAVKAVIERVSLDVVDPDSETRQPTRTFDEAEVVEPMEDGNTLSRPVSNIGEVVGPIVVDVVDFEEEMALELGDKEMERRQQPTPELEVVEEPKDREFIPSPTISYASKMEVVETVEGKQTKSRQVTDPPTMEVAEAREEDVMEASTQRGIVGKPGKVEIPTSPAASDVQPAQADRQSRGSESMIRSPSRGFDDSIPEVVATVVTDSDLGSIISRAESPVARQARQRSQEKGKHVAHRSEFSPSASVSRSLGSDGTDLPTEDSPPIRREVGEARHVRYMDHGSSEKQEAKSRSFIHDVLDDSNLGVDPAYTPTRRSLSRGLEPVPEEPTLGFTPRPAKKKDRPVSALPPTTPDISREGGLIVDSPHDRRRGNWAEEGPHRDSGVHLKDWSDTSRAQSPERRSFSARDRPHSAEKAERQLRRSPLGYRDLHEHPLSKAPMLREPSSRHGTPEPEKTIRRAPYTPTPEDSSSSKRLRYQELQTPLPYGKPEVRSSHTPSGLAAAGGLARALTASPATGHRSVSDTIARSSGLSPSPDVVPRRVASNTSLTRHRTPEPHRFRPDTPGSIRSLHSATPPLRRVDRRISGDLRSLSQRNQGGQVGEPGSARAESSSKTRSLDHTQDLPSAENTNPVANEGRVRSKDMTDVYDGFGEGRIGSPRSPTRPHSMRRRQSMQVLELESKVKELIAENQMLHKERQTADQTYSQNAHSLLADRDSEIDALKRSLEILNREVSRLTEVNAGLTAANTQLANEHNGRYRDLELLHASAARELETSRSTQGTFEQRMRDKDVEIAELRTQLESAQAKVREMQKQILESSRPTDQDFLDVRNVDQFDHRCQQLCQHVQQWVLRFSKFSDMRACRLTGEINDEKIIDRLDNSILDGSDVDVYLQDRVKRRDVFMSMTMNMIWEFIFTRYLFGMDREQRQKLKSLEKHLTEIGPPHAVRLWRAVTLTLLSRRESFKRQRDLDTEAVVQAILETLSVILPPPSHLEDQIQSQLRRVMAEAVDLAIMMRTQRAEYMMLPPLQPEYNPDGELVETVTFNAALMNERGGDKSTTNEELQAQGSIVRVVLFPLVVRKGDDMGVGEDEIVVCPAQVLVARSSRRKSRQITPSSDFGGVAVGASAHDLQDPGFLDDRA